MSPLLEELLGGLRRLAPKGVTLDSRIADVSLPHEDAMRIGLVVNELVTNALKQAFPDRTGHIRVELEVEPDALLLRIEDDGVGEAATRAAAPDSARKRSGQRIITATLKSLNAGMVAQPGPGTRVLVTIPRRA